MRFLKIQQTFRHAGDSLPQAAVDEPRLCRKGWWASKDVARGTGVRAGTALRRCASDSAFWWRSAENEKIQEKNEARIASNKETIEEYKKEYKENIAEENKKYDQVVNEENDRLENLQHLNRKELQHYVQQIDAEEITQKKELESTIDGLLLEIKSIQERLKEDIDDLRHNYLMYLNMY